MGKQEADALSKPLNRAFEVHRGVTVATNVNEFFAFSDMRAFRLVNSFLAYTTNAMAWKSRDCVRLDSVALDNRTHPTGMGDIVRICQLLTWLHVTTRVQSRKPALVMVRDMLKIAIVRLVAEDVVGIVFAVSVGAVHIPAHVTGV